MKLFKIAIMTAAFFVAAAPAQSQGGGTHYFSVTDLIWFHDVNNPTDPDPTPGVVVAETGENDFMVEITLGDSSTEIRKHVGTIAANPDRWIEPRDRDAGELGGELGG